MPSDESPHESHTTCGDWSPWRYSWVGPPVGGHIEAERTGTCIVWERWTEFPYSQDCHDEDPNCGSTHSEFQSWVYHPWNHQCCLVTYDPHTNTSHTGSCRTVYPRTVCGPRVYGEPIAHDQPSRAYSVTQRTYSNPIFWPFNLDAPGAVRHFAHIHALAKSVVGDDWEGDGTMDLPQPSLSPVPRGVAISLALSGAMAIQGVDRYELTVDGEQLPPEGPIETENLRPGDHLVSLLAAGLEGKVRASFVLSIEEPVDLAFADDHLSLRYGAQSANQVIANAILTNRSADEQSVTVSILSSQSGWSAEVDGTRSFLLTAKGHQTVPVRLQLMDLRALAKPHSTFVVAARLNQPNGRRFRDIVATISVAVTAAPELMDLATELAKPDQRLFGTTVTPTFDADVAMSVRPAVPIEKGGTVVR